MLLGFASQRAELKLLEWIGSDWTNSLLKEWKEKERGASPGFAEYGVILYVISKIYLFAKYVFK